MNEDPLTRPGPQDPGTCSDINIPQATPAAEGGALAGFDALASAYAKPGDNLAKARRAFLDINPDEAELTRMVKAAKSWAASAKGHRMSLANWLALKPCPWLTMIQGPRAKDVSSHAALSSLEGSTVLADCAALLSG